jgi:hypothetical protein
MRVAFDVRENLQDYKSMRPFRVNAHLTQRVKHYVEHLVWLASRLRKG